VVLGPAAPANAAAVQATFHVSPSGSDSNPGTAWRPFRTIARARDAVRPLAANMRGNIVVKLRRGDYPVTDTIKFTERDSGTNGFKVIYENADELGSARLVGGKRVTNWTWHSGKVWKAKVGPGFRFDTLYENGRRAVKARTPNLREFNGLSTAKADYLFNDEGSGGSRIRYKAGELDPTGWDLRDAQLYMWPGHNWFAEQVPIKSIDAATRDIQLTQTPATRSAASTRPASSCRASSGCSTPPASSTSTPPPARCTTGRATAGRACRRSSRRG